MTKDSDIDWQALRLKATSMLENSYAPYSKVRVGSAALTTDGRTICGCNVENASIGLSLCAECAVVTNLATHGGGRLRAISTVAGDGAPIAPCGRCRQVLFEFGGAELLIEMTEGPTELAELLPHWFGPEDVEKRADP